MGSDHDGADWSDGRTVNRNGPPGDAPNGASVPPAIATGIGLVAMTPVNWVMVFCVVMNSFVMVAMRLSWRGQAQCGQGDHRC